MNNQDIQKSLLNVFQEQLFETERFALCYAGHQFGSWAGQAPDVR
jgi:uncharacterized protein YdiU (UPF0061 family)